MFKAVTSKIQSFWQNLTHNTDVVSNGSKRKRCHEECDVNYDDDDDPDLIRVEKKRKIDLSNTIIGTIRTSVSNMSYWLKPKAKRYSEEYHVIPFVNKEASSSTIHNGGIIRASHCTEDRPPYYHRLTREPTVLVAPRKDMSSNGKLNNEVREGFKHTIFRHTSNRSVIQHKDSTAKTQLRLLEKERYQQLLQLHSQHSSRQPQLPFRDPEISKTNNDLDIISISSESSSNHHLQNKSSTLMGSIPSSTNIPKHKMTPNRSNLAPFITSNLKLLRSKAPLGSSTCFKHPSVSVHKDWNLITYKGKDDPYGVNTANKPHNKESLLVEQHEPICVIDDDDDEEAICEPASKMPESIQSSVTPKDTQSIQTTDFRIRADFLQSKFINDKEIEDERRARMEEQRRRKCLIEEAECQAKAYAEKRRAQEISLDKSLMYQMRIFDDEPEVSEEIFREDKEEEDKLPELTPEMEMIINNVFRQGPLNEVLSEDFRLQITRADMRTLSGISWLNDEVINFYMNLLMRSGENGDRAKLYAFNTFFYPKIKSGGHGAVKRWTKNVDVFAMHYIVIPVHLGVHWCLCVADMEKKEITYYDSMGAKNNQCLNAVLQYFHDESKAKGYIAFNRNEWTLVNAEDNPQQMNGGDCGMFMCMYAEYITRGKEITFTQEHMPYFRRRMVYEIISKKLLQ